MHLLLESASGFALLDCKQDKVKSNDLQVFGKNVKLVAFQPFTSGKEALDVIQSISEHKLPGTLKNFLSLHLTKDSVLGCEKNMAALLNGVVKCNADDLTFQLLRSGRQLLPKFLSSHVEKDDVEKAQLGLGHAFSRTKVQFNVNKVDNMIIQSIALLDQLDKDINTFAMRAREWYSWGFPELGNVVKDHLLYCRLLLILQDKTKITEAKTKAIKELVMDDELQQQIIKVANSSFGQDLSSADIVSVSAFAKKVVDLFEYRKELSAYLMERMHGVAPNLSALIGELVGARLIAHAGSLTNLSKCPASTVQILGAEKALFRALKKKGNTPKFGLLYHSSFIGRAQPQFKGRVSRFLANKCTIASRIDCFSAEEQVSDVFGRAMKDQVEQRLNNLNEGREPVKNEDVMIKAKELMAKEGISLDGNAVATSKPSDKMEIDEEPKKSKSKKEKKDKKKKKSKTPEDSSVEEKTIENKKVEEVKADVPSEKQKKTKKDKKNRKSETPIETPKKRKNESETPSKKSKKVKSK
eukprot:NODE_226_length_12301_cov_1.446648.p4 type:complete len:526 gc:universal NODE_226_length_12301_cov_1.446648:4099-2522(-)